MNAHKTLLRRTLAFAPAALLAAALAATGSAPDPAPPGRPRFDALVADAKRRVVELGPAELDARLRRAPPPLLIDVRETDEWDAGRIPGAVHLSKGVLEREIERVAPDSATEIVVYCGVDARGALAADSLRRMGYTRVSNLRGGYRAWVAARAAE